MVGKNRSHHCSKNKAVAFMSTNRIPCVPTLHPSLPTEHNVDSS